MKPMTHHLNDKNTAGKTAKASKSVYRSKVVEDVSDFKATDILKYKFLAICDANHNDNPGLVLLENEEHVSEWMQHRIMTSPSGPAVQIISFTPVELITTINVKVKS